MTTTELEELRGRLEAERARLEAELAGLQEQVSAAGEANKEELSGYGSHLADTGTETFEQEKNLALEGNVMALLEETRHALHKMEMGTYGRCDSCGNEIALARLKAFPAATLCIACKSRQERAS